MEPPSSTCLWTAEGRPVWILTLVRYCYRRASLAWRWVWLTPQGPQLSCEAERFGEMSSGRHGSCSSNAAALPPSSHVRSFPCTHGMVFARRIEACTERGGIGAEPREARPRACRHWNFAMDVSVMNAQSCPVPPSTFVVVRQASTCVWRLSLDIPSRC